MVSKRRWKTMLVVLAALRVFSGRFSFKNLCLLLSHVISSCHVTQGMSVTWNIPAAKRTCLNTLFSRLSQGESLQWNRHGLQKRQETRKTKCTAEESKEEIPLSFSCHVCCHSSLLSLNSLPHLNFTFSYLFLPFFSFSCMHIKFIQQFALHSKRKTQIWWHRQKWNLNTTAKTSSL